MTKKDSVTATNSGKNNKLEGLRASASGKYVTSSKSTRRSGKVSESIPLPAKSQGRVVKATIDKAGRVLVPMKLRNALEIRPGDEVQLVLKGNVLELRSLDDAINEAQSVVRQYVGSKKSLVDELITERRADAAKE